VNSKLNDMLEPCSSLQILLPDTVTESNSILELELESNRDMDRTEHEQVVQSDQNWPGT
jgi:hypothetical protein